MKRINRKKINALQKRVVICSNKKKSKFQYKISNFPHCTMSAKKTAKPKHPLKTFNEMHSVKEMCCKS